ncbi:hypothetical protein [Micromonospora sp. CB01531]|uniref:hypothetical protein n=1 Tax=Micromonospora sp. CB01531 TaxID=1718947 RepID=UPI00093F90B8|nr:hypothetical protein [Micromonospora sp. CB01531]OKI51400.1 hypothetical protein A6A27_33540 [Micromonospora sp. CB01531]
MKAATSRDRFDERRRFTGLGEQMGRIRLDADANELTAIWRTEHLRRSADLAEGSPDDGFRATDTHLIDPVTSTAGWAVTGLPDDDERLISVELGLVRRDPETLPKVIRVRGVTVVERTLPQPVDLLRLPVPGGGGATYAAAALVLPVRFVRPRADDEVVATRVLLRAADGTELLVDGGVVPGLDTDAGATGAEWLAVRVDALAALPRTPLPDGGEAALLAGWGLAGLPPRAEVYLGSLLADPELDESDVVLRGGDGTLAGAGRIYHQGMRSFLEQDWRYSLQPDLPDPEPLVRPAPVVLGDGRTVFPSHLLYLDVSEVEVHGFQDSFVREPALDGEDTTFRTRQLTQVRAVLQAPDERGLPPREPGLAGPTTDARLRTDIASGELPDRFPAEQPDVCRDRCLSTENASVGEGYTGSRNLHLRIETLLDAGPGGPVVGWSRNNAATVVPLRANAPAGQIRVLVDPEAAAAFSPGDVVVVEDRRSRLDPGRSAHAPALRRLRAVDSAQGMLEFEPDGHTLTTDPRPLPAGGGLPRDFTTVDAAAVRRWDGADWLVTGVRYATSDGLTWAFSGPAPAVAEYWTCTARVVAMDGTARGVLERLTDAPVRGPVHVRTPIGRVEWTPTGRRLVDLRRQFLPLQEVRDRLIELGRRRLSPGAFTVVVGDGVGTFGDVDQNIAEGVTGDEAIQAAVDLLGAGGGTVYIRKGNYTLEHPVLVNGRSNVRILGDGEATTLTVTGAGGAFYVDWCGHEGDVSIELMRLVEAPADDTPFGNGTIAGDEVGTGVGLPPPVAGGLGDAVPLSPTDLPVLSGALPDLVDSLAVRLRGLEVFGGRASASVVRTIAELRRLQRLHPGRPLEETAPDQLAVLQGLPHGVVTVADSSRVTLQRLDVLARDPGGRTAPQAGVLICGTVADIAVLDCRIVAPDGVRALPYARFLTPLALLRRPRAGLAVNGLTVRGNRIEPLPGVGAGTGVRIADGLLLAVAVEENRIAGFGAGIVVEDQAEQRLGEPVDRTVVRANRVTGAALTGIVVTGDGVDVEDNEIRLAPGTARLRAGVRLAGVGCRLRGNWVSLPASGGAPGFGVEAGVLVGDGVDDGPAVARAVQDVEVSGNRVEGAGAAAASIGVLIGGPQPVTQVRVSDNTLRELGGSGVQAWGYLGLVGDLRVDGNSIEGVALADLAWSAGLVAAAGDLAPDAGVAGAGTPRDVLERLLAGGPGDRRQAIDGVLSWLERATLRGGVVLSLVDGALVDDNRIVDVGTRQAQAAAVPDAPVQTAGVAALGGSELVIRHNAVERIRGVVVVTPGGPIVPPIFRPPVLDVLRRLDIVDPGGVVGLNVHGSVVAVRKQLMEYAVADRTTRQRLGGRIYATMDAVTDALQQQGTSGRRLAQQLAGAVDAMRDAQGSEPHTAAANLARAVLSDAAALTAASPDEGTAWNLAAQFDRALLGEQPDIREAASAVAEAAPGQLTGLEDLGLDVAAQAGAVIGGTGSAAAQRAAQLALAGSLGTLAEGRARSVAFARSMPAGGPTTRDTTLLSGTVRLTLEQLGTPAPGQLTDEALRRLQEGGDALSATLDNAHRELAARLRADLGTTVATRGRPADLERLVTTLEDVQRFAAQPATGARVRAVDVESQRGRFDAELAILTADRIKRQVTDLAVDSVAEATRGLRLLQRSTAQLVNLVAGRPESLRRQAALAAREVTAAIEDVDRREQHRAAASTALQALQDEQARLAGVAISAAATTGDGTPGGAADDPDAAGRLPALAALLAELPGIADAPVRAEAAELFDKQVRRTCDVLGLGADERASVLGRLAAALPALTGADGPAREVGTAAAARLLDELSARAAQGEEPAPAALATRTLIGVLNRAITPAVTDRERLESVQRWTLSTADSLSPSIATRLSAATELSAVLTTVRTGLGGLLPLRPPGLTPRPLPERRDPQPADGLFAAGVRARLGLSGNRVRTARAGAVVSGGAGHPLAPVDDGSGLELSVEANRIVGAVLVGMDLRPAGPSLVDVVDNELGGCAGLPEAGDRSATGAVLGVSGTGQLVLARNRLRRNGDPQWRRLLHEVAIDWRGDVTVQDNIVRHTGAGAGGAGVLVLTDPVAADLVRRLAQEPALTVEPATPAPPVASLPPGGTVLDLPDVLQAGLGDRLQPLTSAAAATTFGVGAFRIASRDPRPVIDRVQLFDPSAVVLDSVAPAAGELERFRTLDTPATGRLLESILRIPPRLVLPFRPARRAVHVGGNDVVAAGPALLVLADGPNLASVNVVGNELESTGGGGAVYLRQVDTTVFAANRCECLPGVTVAVLRGRRSVLTVTGNVVLGSQPAIPPPLPLPPIRPKLNQVGDVTLAVAVGPEASVSLPLDAVAMLKALNRPGMTVFATQAAESEVLFGRFARRTAVTEDPRIRELLAAGTAGRLIQLGGGGQSPLVLRPVTRFPIPTPPNPTLPNRPRPDLGTAERGAVGAEAVNDEAVAAAETTPQAETVRLLIDTTNKILAAPELDGTAKLFGVATTTGMTTTQARALVQAQLTAAGGDADAALARGLVALTGIEDVAPTATETGGAANLLEDVVGLALRSKLLGTVQTPPIIARPPVPRPVDPATRSLVVLGGSRVGVLNNITTAGVHVQDAVQSIENNL